MLLVLVEGKSMAAIEQSAVIEVDDDDLLQEELNRDIVELKRAASTKPEGGIKIPPR